MYTLLLLQASIHIHKTTYRADLSPIRPWEQDTDDGRQDPSISDTNAPANRHFFYGSGDAVEPGYDWDVGESGYGSYM